MADPERTFTIYRIPFSIVAEWPSPNTVDPERRHWFIPYASVLEVVSTLVLAVRLWTRGGKRGGGLGPDDLLIILAWVRMLIPAKPSLAPTDPLQVFASTHVRSEGGSSRRRTHISSSLWVFMASPRPVLTDTSGTSTPTLPFSQDSWHGSYR